MNNNTYRITLLFNANKVYDRQIIQGIGEYIQASQSAWDIFLEEDFLCRIDHIKEWMGDGVIADFDDPEIAEALKDIGAPVIGIGGSYMDEADYPHVPYVATDNQSLVREAYQHLKHKGLEHFACYGLPPSPKKRWAQEREKEFSRLVAKDGYECRIFEGGETSPETWQEDMDRLAEWLKALPKPIGIISVTDSRARHVLQVCEHLGLLVPDSVSVIGIDNEELTRHLTRVPLSSVGQGCRAMGYHAAKLLHQALQGAELRSVRKLIPPTGVIERQSTDFKALKDPVVIQAMHFIRLNACKGIKVDQVSDHIGVSRSSLERRFRQERKQTVHDEIHLTKFERATTLITTTELPIAEIAGLCGYPSVHYLYNVFRKHLNMTPKDYRISQLNIAE
ncbi:DNA-binding transcriptional regulator [Marinobacterium sp. D7]|uniref:XylR family transcriptional regulator n=1 Tax=Marinobacterium ramblicola TaxID=2849041 RepID=UPI001C2DE0D3|nr:DNA-binding transcriptional regulator [Marinobacterium ramblicola]MBV1787641.1 DNA-binding transcriptional regulator [Marinobacterium ramblicola]